MDAAARSYGSAWPLWMEYLTRLDSSKLTAQLREASDRFLATHVPENASGEVRRVAERFAIVAFAGELASTCRRQLTGWQKGEATKGVATCFQAWLQRRGGSGSADTDALMSRIARSLKPTAKAALSDSAQRTAFPYESAPVSVASMRLASPNTWCCPKLSAANCVPAMTRVKPRVS